MALLMGVKVDFTCKRFDIQFQLLTDGKSVLMVMFQSLQRCLWIGCIWRCAVIIAASLAPVEHFMSKVRPSLIAFGRSMMSFLENEITCDHLRLWDKCMLIPGSKCHAVLVSDKSKTISTNAYIQPNNYYVKVKVKLHQSKIRLHQSNI